MTGDNHRDAEQNTIVDRPLPTKKVKLSAVLARRQQQDLIRIAELKRRAAG